MAITLNLKQITELAGHDARRMKQMADEDIFQPIEKPRAQRVPRLYSLSEAAIALIVARLDRYGIKPASMHGIAATIRYSLEAPAYFGFRTEDEAVRLKLNDHFVLSADEHDADMKGRFVERFGYRSYPSRLNGLSADDRNRIDNWIALNSARSGQETMLAVHVRDDGSWSFWFDDPPSAAGVEDYIALRLDRVLSPLNT